MDRRAFLRRASLIAAGAVAADQLDLVERLGWRRKFFPGWSAERAWLTPPLEHVGRYRITGIETSMYMDRPSTITFSLDGKDGSGALVLDAAVASSHRLPSQFHAGDWVQLRGDWGDWPRLGNSLLDS